MAIAAGTRVGPYEILAPIGAGGMGEVYRARDSSLERDVALKVLPEGVVVGAERLSRFEREARLLAALNHPGIASIYAVEQHNNRPALILELVGGETLEDRLKRGPLPMPDALDVSGQIAKALEAAHARGIIHRDLKPSNIKLTSEGRVKLLDFGLAKALRPEDPLSSSLTTAAEPVGGTRSGTVLGTAPYMSPEQARGDEVDRRTDIWAFGCVLYELLTGRRAFPGRTWADTVSAVLHRDPDWELLPAATSPPMRSLLGRCLEKQPTRRLHDIADARIELEEALTSGASQVSSLPRSPRAWLSGRPKRATLGVVTALVVTGLAVVGYQFATPRDAEPIGLGASGRPAIVVIPFEDHSGTEELHWLSSGIPNMLLTGLAQTPGVDVVSSERIHEILKQFGHHEGGAIDKSLVADIARRAGAGAVVVGSVFTAGTEIRIDVQVQDVGSGRLLSAQSVVGADVFPLVDELTGGLQESLGLRSRPAGRLIAEVTTPSLEAYRLYSEALEAGRNMRSADSRELLEKALEIDPSFAMARFKLWRSLAYSNPTLAVEHQEKVLRDIGRLAERQRLRVEASFAAFEGDSRTAAELNERLVARYPDEEEAYEDLVLNYRALRDRDRVLETLERGLGSFPQSAVLRNHYGYELLDLGRYTEAIREFQAYASLRPDEPNPWDSLAEAYLTAGQPDAALEHYARALEIDSSFTASHRGRAWAFAMMGRYDEADDEDSKSAEILWRSGAPAARLEFMRAFRASRVGRLQEARGHIHRGLDLAVAHHDANIRAFLEALAALIAIERGEYSGARDRVDRARSALGEAPGAVRRSHAVRVHLLAGIAEARSGHLNAARGELEAQEAVYDVRAPSQAWCHGALAGEIALSAHDFAAASAAFARGEPELKMRTVLGLRGVFAHNLPFRDGRARVRMAQGDLDGAIRVYRELLSWDVGSTWVAMLEPRYVLQLARLLDQTGDNAGARAEYQRFLDLWENADEGLPELEEARSYLGGSRSSSSAE